MPGDWNWDRLRREARVRARLQQQIERIGQSRLIRFLDRYDPERLGVIVAVGAFLGMLTGAVVFIFWCGGWFWVDSAIGGFALGKAACALLRIIDGRVEARAVLPLAIGLSLMWVGYLVWLGF